MIFVKEIEVNILSDNIDEYIILNKIYYVNIKITFFKSNGSFFVKKAFTKYRNRKKV